MKSIKAKNRNLLRELWDFMKVRKRWWLLPIIIMLTAIALIILFGQVSYLSPFIYAMF